MGNSYTETATGELLLNCEGCGTTDDVEKRATCPHTYTTDNGVDLPVCPPQAMCPNCYATTVAAGEELMFLHSECASAAGRDIDDSIFIECDECGLHSNCKCHW